jgi:hypothetical protein
MRTFPQALIALFVSLLCACVGMQAQQPTIDSGNTTSETSTSALDGTTASKLTLTPSTMNFGTVVVGSYKKFKLTLSASNGSVTISSKQLTISEFSVSGLVLPLKIASGASMQVTLQFKPKTSGLASGKLILSSNAANSPTTDLLSGTGAAAVSHHVSLNWQADANPVVGYNLYRGAQSTGPFARINSALEASTNYTDYSVASGATYFYAATAVNSQGQESGYSSKIKVTIPSP